MINKQKFTDPVRNDLEIFNDFFSENMKGKIWLLNVVTRYILKTKGKQLRPVLVFLTARLNGQVNESVYRAAAMIELMHTATLVHDDVVDESYERRGFFSINALWKNKISVLIGDFLLARGLLLAVKNSEFELLRIMSTAVEQMSEGELLQIEKSRLMNITEEVYYDIIKKKTAVLISACTAAGATASGANAADIEKMKNFGLNLGMAFQLKDDLFDYDYFAKTGKPSGNDLKEKKLTLPLIFVLKNAGFIERRRILSMINRHHHNPGKMSEVIGYVNDNGGLGYTRTKMLEYKDKALEILVSYPASEIREALIALTDYVVEREK